ncbi:MAG: phosphoadenosine phosphosulfate reductase, partial [Actinobacteria bacterium]|nr:phosphoadenosine phosphosulfate reductase [Actinomycetota bacterium]
MTELRVVSHGGGVQTTAMLVLAAQGRIDYQTFLFANVGDDSEHPGTLRYLREIAMPYAAEHGITIHELSKIRVRGDHQGVETLYQRLTRPGSKSLPIPVRMSNGAPGTRSCTFTYKIEVLGKWLKDHGASETNKATVAVGISVDELHRANNRKVEPYEQLVYPLLELGLRRADCQQIIRNAGLPIPGKSACWFCPFHRPSAWQEMSRQEPELFARSCDLENLLNERRDELGKDHVWLTRFNKPLRDVVM